MGFTIKIDTEVLAHVVAKFIQKEEYLQTNILTFRGMSSHWYNILASLNSGWMEDILSKILFCPHQTNSKQLVSGLYSPSLQHKWES